MSTSNTTFTIPTSSGTTSSIYVTGASYASTPTTNFTNSNGSAVMTIPHGEKKVVIDEEAAIEVKGKMILNGIDLEERLSTIENLLNIPTRDVIMEEKYEKLRTLSNQYKQALEEYKTWERLKNSK